jgi:hypothetical protein
MSDRPVSARTRAEDLEPPTGWEKARRWAVKWKDPVVGVMAMFGCVGCLVLAYMTWRASEQRAADQQVVRLIVQQQAVQQRLTAAAAKTSCQRSKQYGPAFADYFERVGVLSAAQADAYRASIEKPCPK